MTQETEIKDLFKTSTGTFVFRRSAAEISDYKKKRKTFEQHENDLQNMQTQINRVDSEISSIKEMLEYLIKKADK